MHTEMYVEDKVARQAADSTGALMPVDGSVGSGPQTLVKTRGGMPASLTDRRPGRLRKLKVECSPPMISAPNALEQPSSDPSMRVRPLNDVFQDHPIRSTCFDCSESELCMPSGVRHDALMRLDAIVHERRIVKSREHLFAAGQNFQFLYAVRVGFFMTQVSSKGRRQVTGFEMAGELLGLDGIGTGAHTCDVVALEDSVVCVIPYEALESMPPQMGGVHHLLHQAMSREIVRARAMMLLLGSKTSDDRVITFLLDLIRRLRECGQSGINLVLRMTREEIGSYLGMTFETVSRVLSRLRNAGVLAVAHRDIHVLDEAALNRLGLAAW